MNKEVITDLETSGLYFEEALVLKDESTEFWHSTLVDKERNPISAGFAQNRMYARKIATAEFLERSSFREIARLSEEIRKSWGLDLIPTACGFAAGFDLHTTIKRSVAEATERWVMSKWIDEGFYIEELNSSVVEANLDVVSKLLVTKFDRILYYRKEILVPLGTDFIKVQVGQTMAILGNGIYPGSSAQTTGGNLWQHALIESYRHLLLVKNNPVQTKFTENKIRFFSKNVSVALLQIENASSTSWPIPQIAIHKSILVHRTNHFLARTIFAGWTSWHLGPIERFLY